MNEEAMITYLLKVASNVVQGIGIRLSVTDYRRWNRAIGKVTARASYWIEDEMQRLCAVELSHKQIGNIMGGRRFGSYPQYNERYAAWKAKYFPGPYWILAGDLVRNIRVFPFSKGGTGRDWMAGIPSGVYDRGGKSWFGAGNVGAPKPIAMYGKKAEELRPMFKPTQDRYAANDWKNRGEQALGEIKKGWG